MMHSSRFTSRDWLYILIILALGGFLFFFHLGYSPLWNNDETYYASIAREILRQKDWINLTFNGRIQFDKPPLYLWLLASSFKLFGQTEFAARVVSALSGVGGLIITYLLGKVMFNRTTGFLAALILATNIQYVFQSHLATLDPTLTLLMSTSLLLFYLGYSRNNPRYYLAMYALFGLATLEKGLIGLILPGAIIVVFLIYSRQLRLIGRMRVPLGLAIYLAFALPWYIAQYASFGAQFTQQFFLVGHFFRYLRPLAGQAGPWYYYFVVVMLGFFPWTCFLPTLFRQAARRDWHNRQSAVLLSIWFLLIFVFFSIAGTKLPNYMLPLYPALAILLAASIQKNLESSHTSRGKLSITLSLVLLATLAVFLVGGGTWVLQQQYPTEYALFGPSLLATGAILIGGAGAALGWYLWRKTLRAAVGIVSLTMVVFFTVGAIIVLPRIDATRPTKGLSQYLAATALLHERIGAYGCMNPGLVYYTGRHVQELYSWEEVRSFLDSPGRVYCVMCEDDYRQLQQGSEETRVFLMTSRSNQVIVSNQGSRP